MVKWLHPMRTSRYVFSEAFNPWMSGVQMLARAVVKNQRPLSEHHPMVEREHAAAFAAYQAA